MTHAEWWRQASFYQIYPRSFLDSNGDGEGDLKGIATKVGYLEELGVEAIWLSPFYPSPLADGGYDVADPRNVDSRFGTLNDFDFLIDALHAKGIKCIVDVVPNHVSVEHPWFKEAQNSWSGSKARERFHFRAGRGDEGQLPPNNWLSVFGGSAWTRLPDGEWYLHLFDSSQPDLNWTNPEVVADGLQTLRFWLDRGVDGFRVDVAFGLMKDMSYADHHDPQALIDAIRLDLFDPNRDPDLPNPREVLRGGPFFDRDEVHEIYRGWRRVLDAYTPTRMSVAEAWAYPASRAMDYARSDELHQVFNFDFMVTPYRADAVRKNAQEVLDTVALVGAPATWVLSNHDSPRVVTRLGGGEAGRRRARVMAMIAHGMPGGVYVFQGEELGLADAEIGDEYRQDPIWFRTVGADPGRDGARVPLPWNGAEVNYGFSSAATLWLPQPPDWRQLAVDSQSAQPASTLSLYRRMLHIRREVNRTVSERDFAWLNTEDNVIAFCRGAALRVIANLGPSPVLIDQTLGEQTVVLLTSGDFNGKWLGADSAIWAR